MSKKDVLIFGMIVQADIFKEGHGTLKDDHDLLQSAVLKAYGASEDMPESELITLDSIYEKDKKELTKEFRDIIKKYVDSGGNDLHTFIGNVYEREIDYGNDIELINEVSNGKGDVFSDELDAFIGKKVRITVEVIEEELMD